MKVGDLVRYESWHTALQDLIGIVLEVRDYSGVGKTRVLWPTRRPIPIQWDWAEELRVIK